jgi:hypothetical protein
MIQTWSRESTVIRQRFRPKRIDLEPRRDPRTRHRAFGLAATAQEAGHANTRKRDPAHRSPPLKARLSHRETLSHTLIDPPGVELDSR